MVEDGKHAPVAPKRDNGGAYWNCNCDVVRPGGRGNNVPR